MPRKNKFRQEDVATLKQRGQNVSLVTIYCGCTLKTENGLFGSKSLREPPSTYRPVIFHCIFFGVSLPHNHPWKLSRVLSNHKGSIQELENAFSLLLTEFGWDGFTSRNLDGPLVGRRPHQRRASI